MDSVMFDEATALLPPLQGCLYCHAEGTVTLRAARTVLARGGRHPVLKCSSCGSVAWLDVDPETPQGWRICYRRVNRSPAYYYASINLGKAGWLSAQEALAISTRGYAQRKRMEQVAQGDLSWLGPVELDPTLPLMDSGERIYLVLKAVTLQRMPAPGILTRASQAAVLDSGKLFVTDRKLHLLGQRRDWSHAFGSIQGTGYDEHSWTVSVDATGEPQRYRGVQVPDQIDAQLVSAVIEALWRMSRGATGGA